MPDLIRRAAVLVLLSAAGIGLLAPLAIAGSATPRALESERLLATADGHAAATTLDRSTLSGRDRPAELSLVGSAADRAPELLAPQPAPDGPGAVPLRASIEPIPTPVPTPIPTPTPTPPPPPPPAPVVAAAPPPPPAAPASSSATVAPFVLDESVWDRLAQCESGGNWSINTGNGYYGGLQFDYSTWHAYGGGDFAEYPHQATREEQITVAERLYAARGFQPWPACREKLGLP